LVFAQPNNQANNLQADAFEQPAYQSEAATWRNIYVVGTKELRECVPDVEVALSSSADLVKNIPLEMACDYVGIGVESSKAGNKAIAINLRSKAPERSAH
jgi:linear primary-alkylsulfatase